jgi:hypothetical protein
MPIMTDSTDRDTIMRDPAWRRRDAEGALRLSPTDAVEA